MPPPSKSILFIQFPNTAVFYSAAVLHRLHTCLTEPHWLITLRFQDEKRHTNILPPFIHLTQGSTCVRSFLRVSSEIQLNMYTEYVVECNTHMRICRFTPYCDKTTQLESMHIALKENNTCSLLALFSRCNFKK